MRTSSGERPISLAIAEAYRATRSECPRVYGSFASMAAASARMDARNSSWFSRAARCTFSKASLTDSDMRLKFSDRSAISAVPVTSTRVPY